MAKIINVAFFIVIVINGVSANTSPDDTTSFISGMVKPGMVTTHPLGIFMMRVDHNFETSPPQKMKFTFNMAAGNVWLPFVKAYQPTEASQKELMKSYAWHARAYVFDTINRPSATMQFHADAVIHAFKPELGIRLTKKSELRLIIPFYYIDKGDRPLTLINNDKSIENFHTSHKKIAGGEDPFARRDYGFNKVNVNYTDEKGGSIDINDNTLVLPGIETHYHYYPAFNSAKMALNFGLHNGINFSQYNRSLDLGVSVSWIKKIKIDAKSAYILAVGSSVVRNKLIQLKNNVNLNSNIFICAGEGEFAYYRKIRKACLSVGLNYFVQTRYNKKKEFDSLILTGNRSYTSHWHWAMMQFYTPLETWSLIFSYSKKTTVSLYIKEDLSVNNAPDLQTGFMFAMPF